MVTISRLLFPSTEILLDVLKPGKNSLNLKDNQIVEAKVARLLPQGKAELLIEGRTVEAGTQMPLKENETLFLKVTREEGKTVLKLVESYTPPQIQEGLSEMRNLGREGPYSSLTKIINPAPEIETATGASDIIDKPSESGSPEPEFPVDKTMTSVPVKQATLKTPEKGFIPAEKTFVREKEESTVQLPASLASKQIPQEDHSLIKTFVADKKIPFELKLGVIMMDKNRENSPVPEKIIQDLAGKILESLPQLPQSEKTQKTFNVPLSPGTFPPKPEIPTDKLEKTVREQIPALKPDEKEIVVRMIENKTIPWDEKALSLLMNQRPETLDEKELKPLLYMLKTALQEGIKETADPKPQVIFVSGKEQPMIHEPDSDSHGTTSGPNKVQVLTQSVTEKTITRTGVHDGIENPPIVRKIRELLNTLSIKPEKPFDGNNLKTMVRDSGLMWENKLREFVETIRGKGKPVIESMVNNLVNNDVKALAMKGVEHGDAVSPKIAENLKSFVDNLEKMQVLNSQASEDSGRYLLPLPYFSGETLKFGQLMIEMDKKKEPEKKDDHKIVRVAFILEMTHLGHIQADVSVFRKSLAGEFLVENSEVKDLIDAAAPELASDLARTGFDLRKLTVRVEDPGTLAGSSLTDRLVNTNNHQVSILI